LWILPCYFPFGHKGQLLVVSGELMTPNLPTPVNRFLRSLCGLAAQSKLHLHTNYNYRLSTALS